MLDVTTQKLSDWLSDAAPSTPIVFDSNMIEKEGLCLLLLDILSTDEPAHRPQGRTMPRRDKVIARYIVYPRNMEPMAAQRTIGNVAAKALDSTEFRVEFCAVPAEIWGILKCPPQPAIFLNATVQIVPQDQPQSPRVETFDVQLASIVQLKGRVFGPKKEGLANANIVLSALGRSTRSDSKGFFTLDGVASSTELTPLDIEVSGLHQRIEVPISDKPMTITFQPKESTDV